MRKWINETIKTESTQEQVGKETKVFCSNETLQQMS